MADQGIEKWTRWLDGPGRAPVKGGVITMFHHRQIWREFARVVGEHGELPDSAYWEFSRDVYAATQAVAVRRQAEHRDKRVASLARLIVEVGEDAEELTPEWWIGLWAIEGDDSYEKTYARRQWNEEFGGDAGEHLDPDIPARDLERLTDVAASVKAWVDKHVAHSEDPGPEPEDPGATAADSLTLDDIHSAVDMIGDLFQRYYSLLTASSMVTLEPVIQHDWLAPFRVPWIRRTRTATARAGQWKHDRARALKTVSLLVQSGSPERDVGSLPAQVRESRRGSEF